VFYPFTAYPKKEGRELSEEMSATRIKEMNDAIWICASTSSHIASAISSGREVCMMVIPDLVDEEQLVTCQ
jgi:hypothetical protein